MTAWDGYRLGHVQIREIDSLEMVAMGPLVISIFTIFFLIFKRMY